MFMHFMRMDSHKQHQQIYLILCLFSFLKLCASSYVVINEQNCVRNNIVSVNKTSSSIDFNAVISTSLIRSNCLIHIHNTDFQPRHKYNSTVQLIGNRTISGMIVVHVFAGHPNRSKPVETFYAPQKWTGHLQSSDMYITFVSLVVANFTISVSVTECMDNCYELNMPSVIPTTIIDLPEECGTNYCLDNYAVTYQMRASSQFNRDSCYLYFPVTNNPQICITVSSYCCGDANNCHIAEISVGHELYFTLDRAIHTPWCLPWNIAGETLKLNFKNKGVIDHTVCTVTIFTNTSNHGKCSLTTTTDTDGVNNENNAVPIAISAAGGVFLILLLILVVYLIRSKRCQPTHSGQVVNYIHHESSVQGRRLVSRCRIVTPPPYSIAIRDRHLTNSLSNDTINNPAESGYDTEVSSTRSDPSENIIQHNGNSNPGFGAPPPYSVSSYDNTTSQEI